MTGSCAQRRHWSRLRAWTARSIAVAGIAGGSWLLGAGLATATPSTPHLTTMPVVAVTAPVIEVVAPASGTSTAAADVESGSAGLPATATSTDIDSADTESVQDDSPSTPDSARPLGVAELVSGIASDVQAQLGPADEPELADPVENSLTEPDTDTTRPSDRMPDTTLDDLRRSGRAEPPQPPAPHIAAPVAAPPANSADEPATVDSEHLAEGTGTDQRHSATASPPRSDHRQPPTSAPVPPIAPPAAPIATATATPPGLGHGLRWMHAVLPTQPWLPGPVRAAGGHIETATLHGIALIEPSASPD
ncbi:hypothetical protein [Saccharopolyspora gloriosae]|uniref:hypothetical protein n=1 Tax=Saccharopolyspora gloriosae TaxID=455344 RepID=UPI001FB7A967|nr:hypothetical protein [Saccharopolyspora gloriosae]